MQSIGRIRRRGQRKDTNDYIIVIDGTKDTAARCILNQRLDSLEKLYGKFNSKEKEQQFITDHTSC